MLVTGLYGLTREETTIVMKIGIVGHEAAKFTPEGEYLAKQAICRVIYERDATEVISGGCHLGGIDIWAIDAAADIGLKTSVFLPYRRSWDGYRERNLKIAEHSDVVVCIVVDKLPDSYTGMTFPLCYHCKTDTHVKSGGCWTAKRAKQAEWIVIPNARQSQER